MLAIGKEATKTTGMEIGRSNVSEDAVSAATPESAHMVGQRRVVKHARDKADVCVKGRGF